MARCSLAQIQQRFVFCVAGDAGKISQPTGGARKYSGRKARAIAMLTLKELPLDIDKALRATDGADHGFEAIVLHGRGHAVLFEFCFALGYVLFLLAAQGAVFVLAESSGGAAQYLHGAFTGGGLGALW